MAIEHSAQDRKILDVSLIVMQSAQSMNELLI